MKLSMVKDEKARQVTEGIQPLFTVHLKLSLAVYSRRQKIVFIEDKNSVEATSIQKTFKSQDWKHLRTQ